MSEAINQSHVSVPSKLNPTPHLSPAQRWLSLAEFALGSAIVIGHNVFHVIPNEVPILFVIGLISLRLRGGGWSALGLNWPESWRRTVVYALAAAALRIILGALVIDPLTAHFWPAAVAPSGSEQITGHFLVALQWLLLVWTFAAFGEEIAYRAYLLTRAAEAGGRSRAADWAAVFLVSVLFGYGHYYKGPSGIVDSGMAGLILGGAYILSGRNLWVCVLAHGFIDTFGVIVAFFGWFS
ncbi:MAG TPA: CPBP family intramembrane glutamic endopeptidase [Candidatus Sulfotelmatobacter sp.]|jgi:membrane protease YdiL (CAAX protease family)|nr:CPBP family intramembrane glutamic endopeptidase [Candidatus Sulfotelmatobacter sp.]